MQKSITFKKNNHTKTQRAQREKVKSAKGFTLLELIFVMVVVGILSSTLILPFASSIKQGTRPEIYATATYLAQQRIEEQRSLGYTSAQIAIDASTNPLPTTINPPVEKKGRTYAETVVTEYVSHSGGNFVAPDPNDPLFPVTEFIKVTVTVGNSDIPNNVELWTILVKNFFNPNANS